MLPAAMDDTPAAVASTKPRSTDFSIAAIMSKEISKNQSSSPGVGNDSPTKGETIILCILDAMYICSYICTCMYVQIMIFVFSVLLV